MLEVCSFIVYKVVKCQTNFVEILPNDIEVWGRPEESVLGVNMHVIFMLPITIKKCTIVSSR